MCLRVVCRVVSRLNSYCAGRCSLPSDIPFKFLFLPLSHPDPTNSNSSESPIAPWGVNRQSGNEDDTSHTTNDQCSTPPHTQTHTRPRLGLHRASPLPARARERPPTVRSAFSPCVFCRTPRRAAEHAEIATSAAAHDEEQERAHARACTKGHEDDDHHHTRRGRGRGRRGGRGLEWGRERRWRRRRGRPGRRRRRARPWTPVRAIASRDESRGARPRATNQQLVGIGQGGRALPRGKEGVCDVRGEVCGSRETRGCMERRRRKRLTGSGAQVASCGNA